MTRSFSLRMPRLILAIVLLLAGILSLRYLSGNELEIAGNNLTSIGLLLGGLVFYAGILVIVAMFENESDRSPTLSRFAPCPATGVTSLLL